MLGDGVFVSPLVDVPSQRLLSELLDQLDAEYGPVDEALVDKYNQLLA